MRSLLPAFLLIACMPAFHAGAQGTDTTRLTLLFAGDIMGHDEQIAGAYDQKCQCHNYEPVFRYIRDYIEQADIAVANLEVTLAGPPYKGYPQFSSPDALAAAARDAGFDVMVMANNHALDRGKSGFIRTLNVLDSLRLIHTGTFADSLSRRLNYPLILEKKGIRLALLNYTYGTNGLTIPKPFIINRIDTAVIRKDLEKARLAKPDFIVVTIHWGEEYQRTENSRQRNLADFILRHGANAIIGSHPHVIQPVRYLYNTDSSEVTPVVYSLGNFVSNQRAQYKDGGIVFGITLEKKADTTRMIHSDFLPVWVFRNDAAALPAFHIIPVGLYEQEPDRFPFREHDHYKIRVFSTDTRKQLINVPENAFYLIE